MFEEWPGSGIHTFLTTSKATSHLHHSQPGHPSAGPGIHLRIHGHAHFEVFLYSTLSSLLIKKMRPLELITTQHAAVTSSSFHESHPRTLEPSETNKLGKTFLSWYLRKKMSFRFKLFPPDSCFPFDDWRKMLRSSSINENLLTETDIIILGVGGCCCYDWRIIGNKIPGRKEGIKLKNVSRDFRLSISELFISYLICLVIISPLNRRLFKCKVIMHLMQ